MIRLTQNVDIFPIDFETFKDKVQYDLLTKYIENGKPYRTSFKEEIKHLMTFEDCFKHLLNNFDNYNDESLKVIYRCLQQAIKIRFNINESAEIYKVYNLFVDEDKDYTDILNISMVNEGDYIISAPYNKKIIVTSSLQHHIEHYNIYLYRVSDNEN